MQPAGDGRNLRHAPDRKKVSCASLAGCCWGWNRESKFQKELSMKLLVGISVKLHKAQSSFCVSVCKMVSFTMIVTATHPISRKICLNCVRTFISGCRWPQSGATPRASKLYGLNFFSFQLPLKHNTSHYEKKSQTKGKGLTAALSSAVSTEPL